MSLSVRFPTYSHDIYPHNYGFYNWTHVFSEGSVDDKRFSNALPEMGQDTTSLE